MLNIEEQELRKKEEIEKTKVKLKDTMQLLEERQNKIKKIHDDLEKGKFQHLSEIKALEDVQVSQKGAITKLNADLSNTEAMLQSSKAEESYLTATVNNLKEEMRKLETERRKMHSNYQRTLKGLEANVKMGYMLMKTDKEALTELELCLDSLKTELQFPFAQEVCRRRKELITKRQEELEKSLKEIDDDQHTMATKIRSKMEELDALKGKHTNLISVLTASKKMKTKVQRQNAS